MRRSDPSAQSKGRKQSSSSCVTDERFRGQQQCSRGHPASLPLDPTEWQCPINSCQGDIVRGNLLLRNSVKDSGEPWKAHWHSSGNKMFAMEKIKILCTHADYPINKVYIYLPGVQSPSSVGTPSACCLLTVLGTSCCSPEILPLSVLALARGAGSLLRNDGCPLVRC